MVFSSLQGDVSGIGLIMVPSYFWVSMNILIIFDDCQFSTLFLFHFLVFDCSDERYRQQRNRVSISKWLRQSIKLYDNFEESMQDLKSFFPRAKVSFPFL